VPSLLRDVFRSISGAYRIILPDDICRSRVKSK
jgi:hypothetical protein